MENYRQITKRISFLYCHSARFGYANRFRFDTRVEREGYAASIRVIEIQLWTHTLLIDVRRV